MQTQAIEKSEDAVEAAPASGPDRAPARGPLRVLLIEDNPADARLIQIMLEEAGTGLFKIESVDRLEAGLEKLSQGGHEVVLSDLTLPDSKGLETFERIHKHMPGIPIIVLSGLNDTTLAVQAVHEGAQDYLIKGQVDGQLLVRSMRYAIERKRMSEQLAAYAEELRSKNAQLEADFNMAREIQEIFLPHQYPTFPSWVAPKESALKFSHRYLPAAAVGGDFFDLFSITETTAGVFICDVMGHGMRAALVTAIMRGLIEELMPVAADPGKFLTEINRSLHAILKRTKEPFLATAFYLVADISSSEVRFSNAGHPSPFILRRESGVVEPLKAADARHGPALGLFDKSSYPNCHSPLVKNDLLFLFTDGLYEATNSEGLEYGVTRLNAALRNRLNLPTDQLLDGLLAEVQLFSGRSDFDDDVCMVGVEATQVGVRFERGG